MQEGEGERVQAAEKEAWAAKEAQSCKGGTELRRRHSAAKEEAQAAKEARATATSGLSGSRGSRQGRGVPHLP